MNPSTQPSRTELIQRLADGELSETERTELLQKIDDETPERWRDVALCLLGNRLLAEGLREDAPVIPSAAPATNVIAFPVWKRLGAIAAALVFGLGLGFVFPRQQQNVSPPLFASVDDFKKAVGDAMLMGGGGGDPGSMLAANNLPEGDPSPLNLGSPEPEPRPFAAPEPTAGGTSEPPGGRSVGGPRLGPVRPAPQPSGEDASEEKAGKLAEIEKHLAEIQRLLSSMQADRK